MVLRAEHVSNILLKNMLNNSHSDGCQESTTESVCDHPGKYGGKRS